MVTAIYYYYIFSTPLLSSWFGHRAVVISVLVYRLTETEDDLY